MTTILIFLAVLFVLILVHEWGHFIVAKLTRMRVDEFAIGFPPRLFSRKYGETEDVSYAVESHHGEVEMNTLYGILVSAADAIKNSFNPALPK